MYTLIRTDPLNTARVLFTSACGKTFEVATVEFLEEKENMVVVTLTGGKQSLATIGKIYEIVKLELDNMKKW